MEARKEKRPVLFRTGLFSVGLTTLYREAEGEEKTRKLEEEFFFVL